MVEENTSLRVPRNGRKSLLIPRHGRDGGISERLFQCKLEGDKVPSARAIQTLVQVWKEMRGWYKRRELARGAQWVMRSEVDFLRDDALMISIEALEIVSDLLGLAVTCLRLSLKLR
jgi:hypothetical protein